MVLGVLFFVVLGFRDGMLKKIYGIVGFWAGLVVATRCMYVVGESFIDVLHLSKEVSHILAFCAIFLVFVLFENFVYRRWGSNDDQGHKFWSRIGGAIIGGIQGFVAVSIVLILLVILNVPSESSKQESFFYAPFVRIAPHLFDYSTTWLPESKSFVEMMKEHFQDVDVK
jgi:uncharacterized membrane protein required for colicin V production